MPSRNWLAVTSILLIAGAAGVAVPLALRVAAGKHNIFSNRSILLIIHFKVHLWKNEY